MSSSVPGDHIRVGTAEKDATAQVLNRAFEAGRLTPDELDERLEACFTAKTRGELATLTVDLPESETLDNLHTSPSGGLNRPTPNKGVPATRIVPGTDLRLREPTPKDLWLPWAGVSALVLMIWFITAVAGGGSYFWPIWVIGPWGVVNTFVTIGMRARKKDDGDS